MTQQQQPTHTPEPWHYEPSRTRICDAEGSTVFLAHDCFTCNPRNAERIVACVNALANVADPAAALQAAREALEECTDQMCSSTHQTAPYPDCECWACERTRRVRAALSLLKGDQP